jgi:hypothetical protein
MSDEETVAVTSVDAVNMAADGDVNGFKSAINDLLMDRVKDTVDLKRFEVQNNFMSSVSDDVEQETETEE